MSNTLACCPVARNVGRSLKRIPGQAAISFLEKTPQGTWAIKRFDTQPLVITTIGEALAGSEDVAWTRNGLMLMSNGTSIQFRRPGGKKGWQPVKMRSEAQPLNHATRLAVNPANDRLAVVVDE